MFKRQVSTFVLFAVLATSALWAGEKASMQDFAKKSGNLKEVSMEQVKATFSAAMQSEDVVRQFMAIQMYQQKAMAEAMQGPVTNLKAAQLRIAFRSDNYSYSMEAFDVMKAHALKKGKGEKYLGMRDFNRLVTAETPEGVSLTNKFCLVGRSVGHWLDPIGFRSIARAKNGRDVFSADKDKDVEALQKFIAGIHQVCLKKGLINVAGNEVVLNENAFWSYCSEVLNSFASQDFREVLALDYAAKFAGENKKVITMMARETVGKWHFYSAMNEYAKESPDLDKVSYHLAGSMIVAVKNNPRAYNKARSLREPMRKDMDDDAITIGRLPFGITHGDILSTAKVTVRNNVVLVVVKVTTTTVSVCSGGGGGGGNSSGTPIGGSAPAPVVGGGGGGGSGI